MPFMEIFVLVVPLGAIIGALVIAAWITKRWPS